MSTQIILSCHPDSLDYAINELHQPGPLGTPLPKPVRLGQVLGPGTFRVETDAPWGDLGEALRARRPIFIRHAHPVDRVWPTAAWDEGPERIATQIVSDVPVDRPWAVQLNLLTDRVQARRLSDALNHALEVRGAQVSPKAPDVLSLTVTDTDCYVGCSDVADNLSPWPGGRTRLRRQPDQVSRAAFKLEEALEAFEVPSQPGHALDLGAAPGSWTQVLVARGWTVTAIDPAMLDPRVAAHPAVTHFDGTTERYLELHQATNQVPLLTSLIVNDMKMDVRPSTTLTAQLAQALGTDCPVLITFKLPSKGYAARITTGIGILRAYGYTQIAAKQLMHNRSEITVCAKR